MRLPSAIAILAVMALVPCLGACHAMPQQSLPGDSPGKSASRSPAAAGEGNGKAHVYVYLGRTHGQLFSYPNWHDSDFYINGIAVGTVTTADYLDIDLEPGVYAFSWRRSHNFLGTIESPRDYDMLQPGQEVFLTLNVDQNAGSLLPPIGWWIDPDTGNIGDAAPLGRVAIIDRRISRPNSAILAQLHPIAGPGTYLPPSW
jgi:hypothetical protein